MSVSEGSKLWVLFGAGVLVGALTLALITGDLFKKDSRDMVLCKETHNKVAVHDGKALYLPISSREYLAQRWHCESEWSDFSTEQDKHDYHYFQRDILGKAKP